MNILALDEAMLIPLVAIGGAFITAIIIMLALVVRSIAVCRAREQTKRELAAYVAEGTMDAETAVGLANSGTSEEACGDKDWT